MKVQLYICQHYFSSDLASALRRVRQIISRRGMADSTFVLELSSATSSLDILGPLTAQLEAAAPLACIDLTALCHAPMSSMTGPDGILYFASVEHLRAALLRHVPSLVSLKLPDACASPALLRALGQSSSLEKLYILISNKDGSGAEHLLDQPAWHSLAGLVDSGAEIEIDFGEYEWSAAHVARFWSMGSADLPLPFTSVKMGGSYDGTVPFDSGTLQRIANSCPDLEALDLTGPDACLPAGEPQPPLAEGLLDLLVKCQLDKLCLMNVRLKTTDVYRIMSVSHLMLKKLQLSFSLVEPGRMGDIFSNVPDVDEPYTQVVLVPAFALASLPFAQLPPISQLRPTRARSGRLRSFHILASSSAWRLIRTCLSPLPASRSSP